jgi:hypothetical protein
MAVTCSTIGLCSIGMGCSRKCHRRHFRCLARISRRLMGCSLLAWSPGLFLIILGLAMLLAGLFG